MSRTITVINHEKLIFRYVFALSVMLYPRSLYVFEVSLDGVSYNVCMRQLFRIEVE